MKEHMERVNDVPFDSSRKLMTTIHRYDNKYRVITKGAPDVLINRCTKVVGENLMSAQNIRGLSEQDRNRVNQYNENMASKALRVIAVRI